MLYLKLLLSAQLAEFAIVSILFHFHLLLKYTNFLQIIPRMMRENQNLKKKYQNSRGKRIIKNQAKNSKNSWVTYLFLTTQIFNIFHIFFNINTNINIKTPKKFNINIKINNLQIQISISISKSIFWMCSFQYQNQYQYFQNFDFSKIFKILCHVCIQHIR